LISLWAGLGARNGDAGWCAEAGGGDVDVVAVRFQERADFLVRAADGRGGDAEEPAEEVHGGELAELEHCPGPEAVGAARAGRDQEPFGRRIGGSPGAAHGEASAGRFGPCAGTAPPGVVPSGPVGGTSSWVQASVRCTP